jgi:4-diphosphocytidyl-2-C-methyl-D-erythritol kinase
LKKDFPQLTALQLHLHKAIPAGSGLGGGSSDGAFTLKLLNQKFNLGLSTPKLLEYALQLGSDCPFFIINEPCIATGRGELLEPIPLNLSAYKFVIVYPGIHISTAWAFEQLKASDTYTVSDAFKSIETWKEELRNDFERPVFGKHPEIKIIKEEFYNAGAIYASLSGSGSTVYGIFKKNAKVSISFPQNYFVKELAG